MVFFLALLLAFALELLFAAPRRRAGLDALGRRLYELVPRGFAPVALGALVVTFAIELAIVARVAHACFANVPWLRQLPIPMLYASPVSFAPQVYRVAFAAVSLLEALLLGAFLLAARNREWKRADTIASVIAAAAIVVLAVASPAMTSSDMYAYVGYALLGPSVAYTPPTTPLPGEFALIHHMWRRPINPAAYGPLWLWWNSAVVGLAPGLHAKLIALRLVNVAALGVVLGSLRLFRVAPRLIAATAANPAIAFHYVTNGHNDLVAIAIVLGAMTFAARSPLGAGIVAGIGASCKLTLIAPAATVALAIAALPRRLLYCVVLFVTAAAIAIALGGKPYLHALSVVAYRYRNFDEAGYTRIPHFVVALLTLAATGLAVSARRTLNSAVFGFVSLAQAYYPWYAIWGLPYAATRSSALVTLLVGFPVVTAVLDNDIRSNAFGWFVIIALLFAVAATLMQRAIPGRLPAKV